MNHTCFVLVWVLGIAGCTGSEDAEPDAGSDAASIPQFTIGGSVGGLIGSLELQLAGRASEVLPVGQNGPFAFAAKVGVYSFYVVSVKRQPATQTCTVHRASGSVGESAVTNLEVICATTVP